MGPFQGLMTVILQGSTALVITLTTFHSNLSVCSSLLQNTEHPESCKSILPVDLTPIYFTGQWLPTLSLSSGLHPLWHVLLGTLTSFI